MDPGAEKETSGLEITKESSSASPEVLENGSVHAGEVNATAIPEELVTNKWQQFANRLIGLIGAEARGIERVDDALRTGRTSLRAYYEMASMWFSINLTASRVGADWCMGRTNTCPGQHLDDWCAGTGIIWLGDFGFDDVRR